jgi:plasmid stabilization system protein ParE
MKVRFSLEAQLHISAIFNYINERNPLAARRVVARIRQAAERLGDFPYMGRVGLAPGTREWVVSGLPYIIVYEAHPQTNEIIVLGVYHGAQLRPGEEQGR